MRRCGEAEKSRRCALLGRHCRCRRLVSVGVFPRAASSHVSTYSLNRPLLERCPTLLDHPLTPPTPLPLSVAFFSSISRLMFLVRLLYRHAVLATRNSILLSSAFEQTLMTCYSYCSAAPVLRERMMTLLLIFCVVTLSLDLDLVCTKLVKLQPHYVKTAWTRGLHSCLSLLPNAAPL